MKTTNLLAACLIVMSTGCAQLRAFELALEEAGLAEFDSSDDFSSTPGRSVAITGEWSEGIGQGAVLGPRHIITVEHVLGSAQQVAWVGTSRRNKGRAGWVKARVVKRIPAYPETLLVLELEVDTGVFGTLLGFTGFDDDDSYVVGGGTPQNVALGRGLRRWRDGLLRPGDSGSPVLNRNGELIGLVTGRRGSRGVFTRALPSSAGLRAVLASYSGAGGRGLAGRG